MTKLSIEPCASFNRMSAHTYGWFACSATPRWSSVCLRAALAARAVNGSETSAALEAATAATAATTAAVVLAFIDRPFEVSITVSRYRTFDSTSRYLRRLEQLRVDYVALAWNRDVDDVLRVDMDIVLVFKAGQGAAQIGMCRLRQPALQ